MAVDWKKIEQDYIRDESQTAASLGEKYGVHQRTVGRHITSGDWIGKRAQYSTKKSQKRLQLLADSDAARVNKVDRILDNILDGVKSETDAGSPPDRERLEAYKCAAQTMEIIGRRFGIKSEADRKAQEAKLNELAARTAMLKAQTEAIKQQWHTEPVQVVISGDDDGGLSG